MNSIRQILKNDAGWVGQRKLQFTAEQHREPINSMQPIR